MRFLKSLWLNYLRSKSPWPTRIRQLAKVAPLAMYASAAQRLRPKGATTRVTLPPDGSSQLGLGELQIASCSVVAHHSLSDKARYWRKQAEMVRAADRQEVHLRLPETRAMACKQSMLPRSAPSNTNVGVRIEGSQRPTIVREILFMSRGSLRLSSLDAVSGCRRFGSRLASTRADS